MAAAAVSVQLRRTAGYFGRLMCLSNLCREPHTTVFAARRRGTLRDRRKQRFHGSKYALQPACGGGLCLRARFASRLRGTA